MRLTWAGPLGSRINSPARAVGSLPEFILCRFTGIGASCSMPHTTSIWKPFGSVRRTRLPPPGSSMFSTPVAPGALASFLSSSSLST